MKNKEIKIVMSAKYDDETGEAVITSYDTVIYIDDKPVGLVQDIKVHANVQEKFPTIDITFPEDNILCKSFNRDMVQYKKVLENIPNVTVHTTDLTKQPAQMVTLDEVGTDGHIDVYRRDFKVGDIVIIKPEAWKRFCKSKKFSTYNEFKPIPQRIMKFSATHHDMVMLQFPLWWFNEDEIELANEI